MRYDLVALADEVKAVGALVPKGDTFDRSRLYLGGASEDMCEVVLSLPGASVRGVVQVDVDGFGAKTTLSYSARVGELDVDASYSRRATEREAAELRRCPPGAVRISADVTELLSC
mgnify:CR=1 FL=1